MTWRQLIFVVIPYAAVVLAVTGSILRFRYRPWTVTSATSQLLEHRKLYWGSIAFHWGILLVLAGHLLAVIAPMLVDAWNASPWRLFAIQATGLALGLWALAGLLVLGWRRLSDGRVRAVTLPMDVVLLVLLFVSVVTGVVTGIFYGSGMFWFTSLATPYLRSLVTFAPRPDLIIDLPVVIQIHVMNLFVLLAVLPFSRLIHMITLPLGYLVRPWQLIIWNRRPTRAVSVDERR